MSARKVLPTLDYKGFHLVKLKDAVACGEVRVVAIDFLLLSKRFINKKQPYLKLHMLLINHRQVHILNKFTRRC